MMNYVYSLNNQRICRVSCESVGNHKNKHKFATSKLRKPAASGPEIIEPESQDLESWEKPEIFNFSRSSDAVADHVAIIYMQRLFAISILLFICIGSVMAVAQEPELSETVVGRLRPEFDARGLPVGVFQILPTLNVDFIYDNNIFANNNFKVDDLITLIVPELIVEAEWSRVDLEIGGDLAIGRYLDVSSEDYEDWRIWGDLGVDLGRGLLIGEARYEDLHERRTSPDDSRGIRPTQYTLGEFLVGYRNGFGRFMLRAELAQRALSYDDTQTLNGSESNKDRDRTRNDVQVRMGYGESQRFQPFVQINLTEINYDQKFDNDGFQRSSDGFDIVAGTGIDLSGRTFGEVFIGYVSRNYDDPRFNPIDEPIFGGEITWNVTGLTTLNFSANRLIKSTTIVGAAGITATGFGFEVDHELLRNLILSFDFATINEDFEGIDRTDDIFRTELEAIYMMNRYLRFRLGGRFLSRDTSPPDSGGIDYDIQRIFFGIQGQF